MPNEAAARRTVRDHLKSWNEELVYGLTLQEQQVWIRQFALSANTPPSSFPFVAVTVARTSETVQPAGNTRIGQDDEARHRLVVILRSLATAQFGDFETYDRSDEAHQTIGDRIITKLKQHARAERWLIDDESTARFEIDLDGGFTKDNRAVGWEQDNAYHSGLETIITFDLLECVNDKTLW